MYTRNQGNVRPTPMMKSPVLLSADAVKSGGTADHGSMPILIPQDYRGEFLRGHRASPSELYEASDTTAPTDTEPAENPQDENTADTDLVPVVSEAVVDGKVDSKAAGGHSTSLIGGLYDLLLGENSSEEETLLLLGIGLLLLWGHLDRGGIFDRSTWDGDDLALLLIGYLLLS